MNAAVVQTKQTVPMNLTLTGADFASFIPGLAGALPPSARIGYSGTVAATTTTWIDPSAKKLLKSKTDATLSIDMSITGVPSAAGLGSFRISGTESTTFQPI